MPEQIAPEFSRIVNTDEQVGKKNKIEIEANEKECAALAERFELIAINSLKATLTITTAGNGEVTLRGPMHADIIQRCVATLEPVPEIVEDEVEVLFSPHISEDDLPSNPDDLDDLSEEELMALLDQPEPLVDGKIDVGEVVSQFLAVAMDPYPRKDGAKVADVVKSEDDEEERPNPFAKLASLKEQLEKKN